MRVHRRVCTLGVWFRRTVPPCPRTRAAAYGPGEPISTQLCLQHRGSKLRERRALSPTPEAALVFQKHLQRWQMFKEEREKRPSDWKTAWFWFYSYEKLIGIIMCTLTVPISFFAHFGIKDCSHREHVKTGMKHPACPSLAGETTVKRQQQDYKMQEDGKTRARSTASEELTHATERIITTVYDVKCRGIMIPVKASITFPNTSISLSIICISLSCPFYLIINYIPYSLTQNRMKSTISETEFIKVKKKFDSKGWSYRDIKDI